ncbi:MAG: TRAP transporter large permease subunit [Halieaceae bacterium]|nr:TRAP transporter large permease subunit [Halieaceae bacterium]
MDGSIGLLLFGAICALLLFGFPVALTLGGTALLFAAVGIITNTFDANLLAAIPARVFGIMTNETLIAVPLFVMMGVILEKSKIAEDLLVTMSKAFGRHPGGLGLSVVFVGMLLAASTGIVGATVVTMGLLSLPSMLNAKYSPSLAAGTICATGTLGQIIPPSIALVLLGDVMSNAYQRAQLNMGIFNTKTVSVGDLFIAAIGPGVLLVVAYAAYIFIRARINPEIAPAADMEPASRSEVLQSLLPPLALIGIVLGSILVGAATPTEAAGVGAIGALILALFKQRIDKALLQDTLHQTLNVTAMVFLILVGATLFSLVFRGFGGEELIQSAFESLPGGVLGALFVVMLVIFLLGFILDFIEITFVVVPIVGPILLMMGIDPIWLGIMIALNLQTSFLTPPFGFALFYLRGVAPSSLTTGAIYRGVIPFIIIQLAVLALLWAWPPLATYLPSVVSP